MKQKKILFLGGSMFQLPPIKYANEQGHHTILCDYIEDNYCRSSAKEFYHVSTTDKEAVLKLAESLQVDGVVAYASDPAAPTQAYVGNKLGLPSNPYESVEILCRKDKFRDFLGKNNFLVPKSNSFYEIEEAKEWAGQLKYPIIVKPVDSSGSKGVSKVDCEDQIEEAFRYALGFSREKKVVVEEYFFRDGYQVAGDGFVVDGKLAFRCWANEHFDKLCNPRVPIGESFPSIMSHYTTNQAHRETQRLLDILGMERGALNFDFHFNRDGDFSFLELGPRNGGCLIPDTIKYATGVDLIAYTVDSALGLDCGNLEQVEPEGYYSSYMVHAINDGIVKSIWISDEIKTNIVESNIFVKPGDVVKRFDGSNHTLGTMILQYSTEQEMLSKMNNMEEYIRIITND